MAKKRLFSIVIINLENTGQSCVFPNIHQRQWGIRGEILDAIEMKHPAVFADSSNFPDHMYIIPCDVLLTHPIIIVRQEEEIQNN